MNDRRRGLMYNGSVVGEREAKEYQRLRNRLRVVIATMKTIKDTEEEEWRTKEISKALGSSRKQRSRNVN